MFIVKTVVDKPAGTAFRAPQLIAGTSLSLGAWTRQQAGVIKSRVRRTGVNRIVSTITFTDQAAAEAYLAALANNSEYQARQAYNAANGITSTVRKFQEVA